MYILLNTLVRRIMGSQLSEQIILMLTNMNEKYIMLIRLLLETESSRPSINAIVRRSLSPTDFFVRMKYKTEEIDCTI